MLDTDRRVQRLWTQEFMCAGRTGAMRLPAGTGWLGATRSWDGPEGSLHISEGEWSCRCLDVSLLTSEL